MLTPETITIRVLTTPSRPSIGITSNIFKVLNILSIPTILNICRLRSILTVLNTLTTINSRNLLIPVTRGW